MCYCCFFFFSSRRRHTRFDCDWSSDVCSSDLSARASAWRSRASIAQPVALSPRGGVVAPYFWRNRSTRPAVSTSFCLPVKYGWHLAQTSTWIRGTVERVTKLLPHAHFTVAR